MFLAFRPDSKVTDASVMEGAIQKAHSKLGKTSLILFLEIIRYNR